MSDTIRVAVGISHEATDDELALAGQMGCSGVVVPAPRLPDGYPWAYDDLARLRQRVDSFGLRLEAIQHTPLDSFDHIRLGLPDRDEHLDHYCTTIRNMGRAGIPVLGYNWRPNRLYRTGTVPGRGGARVTAFDLEQAKDLPLSHGRAYTADELWATYDYFVRTAIPVAEQAGVRLALHPDDPPGPAIGGVARILSSFEAFRRADELVDSPSWGLLFCMGCWSEMGGNENVLKGIRYFGPRGKIVYVHFRDVQGTADQFTECFIGEGNVDITAALRALKEVGFTGFLIDDHVPHMAGDTGWAPRGRAYATGYIMGVLRAITDLT